MAVEFCDDGNKLDGEGCSADCTGWASGWKCSGGSSTAGNVSVCTTVCGDGILISPYEQCDNDNSTALDGCSQTCTVVTGWDCSSTAPGAHCAPICGDDRRVADEVCDDGNNSDGVGCAADCMSALVGYVCTGGKFNPPANDVCTLSCGDGIIISTEQCDNN